MLGSEQFVSKQPYKMTSINKMFAFGQALYHQSALCCNIYCLYAYGILLLDMHSSVANNVALCGRLHPFVGSPTAVQPNAGFHWLVKLDLSVARL